MAQLKDLIVTGATRLIGTLNATTIVSTTQSAGDNSTKVATTEYVDRAIGNAINSSY